LHRIVLRIGIPPLIRRRPSRRVVLLAALWLVPWAIVAFLLLAPPGVRSLLGLDRGTARASAAIRGKPGPWGQLSAVPLMLAPPDELVALPPPDAPPVRWVFQGYSQQKAIAFLRTAGLTEVQLDALVSKAAWSTLPEGAAVEPGDDLILGLSPAARAKIYFLLVEFPPNNHQIDPLRFRPSELDAQFKGSGLARPSIALFRRLLYPQGPDSLVFADMEPALRRLGDDAERRRFIKAVYRKETFLLRMRIDADSDVEKLAAYWGVGGRRRDLLSLLRATRRLERSASLNIVMLLPPFARDRLYSFPFLSSVAAPAEQDCIWSAFNFFNDPPDDRFNDLAYVGIVLKKDYYEIYAPSQLGDLVLLTTPDETVVHAAAYIADDIVFTKNGHHPSQPWIFMRLQEMVDIYEARYPRSGPLKTRFARRKIF
jgi:hypothetical protein